MHYASMESLIKSISPDVKAASIAALSEPQRTDTALHLAHVGNLRERDLQAACFERFAQLALVRPEYGLIFAIPNGQYRHGQRMEPGLKSGVLDFFVPVMRGGYGGLFCELKVGRNQPSDNQRWWIKQLTAQGYYCCVIWDSVDAVVGEIEAYLALEAARTPVETCRVEIHSPTLYR